MYQLHDLGLLDLKQPLGDVMLADLWYRIDLAAYVLAFANQAT